MTGLSGISQDVQNAVYNAASTFGVDPNLIFAIGQQESGNNANAPRGGAGEYGPFQILPSTVTWLQGIFSNQGVNLDPNTLQGNANLAAANIAELENKYGENISDVVAGYNQGLNATPNTATTYVRNVLANLASFGNSIASPSPSSTPTATASGTISTGDTWQDVWNNFFNKGANSAPPVLPKSGQALQQQTVKQESGIVGWLNDNLHGLEIELVVGTVAVALIGGGFLLIANDHPQIVERAATAVAA